MSYSVYLLAYSVALFLQRQCDAVALRGPQVVLSNWSGKRRLENLTVALALSAGEAAALVFERATLASGADGRGRACHRGCFRKQSTNLHRVSPL